VEEIRRLINAKTKKDAVRRALPIEERLARSKALADAIGPSDPAYDMKVDMDRMWRGR